MEDAEKYIRAFKGVILIYDPTWKDVMYVLGQTLNPDSKLEFWRKLFHMEMNGLVMNQQERQRTR